MPTYGLILANGYCGMNMMKKVNHQAANVSVVVLVVVVVVVVVVGT